MDGKMKTKILFVLLLIISLVISVLPMQWQVGNWEMGAGEASATTWPSGYGSRIGIDISDAGGGAKGNYSIMVDVFYNCAAIENDSINQILYRPATRYDGTHDRTYFINVDSAGITRIRYWDEDDLALSAPVQLAAIGSGYDHDGGNIIILGNQTGGLSGRNGTILAAYSAVGNGTYTKGSSNVEDISSWGNQITVATGDWVVYPTLVELSNSTVMCFYNNFTDLEGPVYYKIATLNSNPSSDSWGAATLFADLCDTQTYYRSWFDGSDIHFILGARYGGTEEALYQDVWYIKYETSDGTWRTADGTQKYLPLDKSDADHTPDVVWASSDSPYHSTKIEDIKTDGSNNPYLVFTDSLGNTSPRTQTGDIYVAYYSGGWQSNDTGVNTSRHGQGTYNPMAGAELDEYDVNIMYACAPDAGNSTQVQAYQNVSGTWYIADGNNGTTAIDSDGKITQASPGDNFRPITVLHGAGHFKLLWFYSENYTDPNNPDDWDSMRLGWPGFSSQNLLGLRKENRSDFGELILTQSDGETLQPSASLGKPWIQEKTDYWRAILWWNAGTTPEDVEAILTTSLTGSNNDLIYTAQETVSNGNDISITYTDPASALYGATPNSQLVGSGDDATGDNVTGYALWHKYTATATGPLSYIRVKATASGTAKVAIYADSGGTIGSRLGKQDTATSCVSGWNVIALESVVTITNGTDYWIAVAVSATGVSRYKAGGSRRYAAITYGTWTWPSTPPSTSADSYTSMLQGYSATFTPTVGVSGSDITVTLATDNDSAIATTATAVKTAVDGYGSASALVSVANAGGNDGTGLVTAMSHTHLSGHDDNTQTMYIYYNNASETNPNSQSIMDAQFPLGCDHFDTGSLDTTRWTVVQGDVSVASSYLELTGTIGTRGIIDGNTTTYPAFPYPAEYRAKWKGSDSNPSAFQIQGMRVAGGTSIDDAEVFYPTGADTVRTYTGNGGSYSTNDISDTDTSNWHIWRIGWISSIKTEFRSDVNKPTSRQVTNLHATHTTNIDLNNQTFHAYEGNDAGGIVYIDWVFVRPLTDPEPVINVQAAGEQKPLEITTLAATVVLSTSATLNGNVTEITSAIWVGFVYGDNDAGDPGDVAPSVSGWDGYVVTNSATPYETGETFALSTTAGNLTPLSIKTCYYFRVWGNSSSGVNDYGDVLWFCTSSEDIHDFGTVKTSSVYFTGTAHFYFENCGDVSGNVSISGTDVSFGGNSWDLADDGAPGDMTYALKAVVGNYTTDTFDAKAEVDVLAKNFQFGDYYAANSKAYFYPWGPLTLPLATLLEYDTTLDFSNSTSYNHYHISTITGNSSATGFGSGFLDDSGGYIYLPAYRNIAGNGTIIRNTITARGNLSADLQLSSSWELFDTSTITFAGGLTYYGWAPGVYASGKAYYCPLNDWGENGEWGSTKIHGRFLRFSGGDFTDESNWDFANLQNLNLFAAGYQSIEYISPYVYIIPFCYSVFIRYDTTKAFNLPGSYTLYNLQNISALSAADSDANGFTGWLVHDSTELILVPFKDPIDDHTTSVVVKYDTAGNFTDEASYEVMDLHDVDPDAGGYQGAWEDSNGFVWFVPCLDVTNGAVPPYVVWDSSKDFEDPASWFSLSSPGVIYTGAIWDGNYAYLVPFGLFGSGTIARIDSAFSKLVTVRETAPYETLYVDLPAGNSTNWLLQALTPTSWENHPGVYSGNVTLDIAPAGESGVVTITFTQAGVIRREIILVH